MNKRDWSGNTRSAFSTLGARNYALEDRQVDDYYATDPKATRLLLQLEKFDQQILEPACGEGHIAEPLKEAGYTVTAFDKINRGYGSVQDFFDLQKWGGDIVTNPPFKYAREFVEHALSIIPEGHKVALFLKLQFLESKVRRKMFEQLPPKIVYVSSDRLCCAKNGDFETYGNNRAICFCWYIWVKGYKGDPIIRWFN